MPRRRLAGLITGLAFIGLALLIGVPEENNATPNPTLNDAAVLTGAALVVPLELPAVESRDVTESSQSTEAPDLDWQTVTVSRGDTLGGIFNRIGLSATQLHEILSINEDTASLTRIHPGQSFSFKIDDDGQLQALKYEMDDIHTLMVTNTPDGLQAATEARPVEVRIGQATGVITSSLFGAAQESGLSDNVIMKLANIFGYDIDFALDIRQGDSFAVVFEEQFIDGRKVRDGEILAAEFTNRDKTHRALRYTDPQGNSDYYGDNGQSLRKAFLRTPVEFSRISSYFSLGRKHPILNKIRAHKGVDYAAPTGTPVRATADGRVTLAGRKGGYGNAIILQHGRQYSTLYGHLSRFAKGIRNGTTVSQGQIIGYVGSTGLATGPHLHYEFRVNGTHVNPLGIKTIAQDPLPGKYMTDFRAKTGPLVAQLNLLQRLMVAYHTP